MSQKTWTIRDVLKWSVGYLKEHHSQSPRLDADLLLASCLSCQRLDLYLYPEKPLTLEERESFRGYLQRRARGEPVAYILGKKEFYGLEFDVNSHVLIPRPDSEILVEKALELLEEVPTARVLDIGTGSGCLAISLKSKLEKLHLDAWDKSEDALEVARANALKLGQDICFIECDALDEANWDQKECYDLIVSNPPYISEEEYSQLAVSVKEFEPFSALVAKERGLEFYSLFAKRAAQMLKPGGSILMEIGYSQAQAVMSLFSAWQVCECYQDLAGLDRLVWAKKA